jgi:hypothetical protein
MLKTNKPSAHNRASACSRVHFEILLTLLLGLFGPEGYAQVVLDSNFENGRLDSAYTDDGAYVVAPISNLHFRATQAKGAMPVFKIFDFEGYRLRPYHHMVYRYEGDSIWHFFDTAYKANSVDYYHFHNTAPFLKDTVYVAYWFPYTYTDLEAYLNHISGSPLPDQSGRKRHHTRGQKSVWLPDHGYDLQRLLQVQCSHHCPAASYRAYQRILC